MFFIYGTDAPIYHLPITTTAMIVVNIGVHIVIDAANLDILPYILAFGDGFHPLQMLTHNFLHAGWLHLLGNMLFLFPFGLIVEGKIGWWRMLILYIAIGMAQGFTQQLIMLPSDPMDDAQALVALFDDPENPMDEEAKEELTRQWREDLRPQDFGSLGASAVIFGLLAVCVVWAPVNNFDVYFRWTLFIPAPDDGLREWSVATIAGIFVVKEFFMFLMMGAGISSEALHLNGFVVGLAFGLVTLYYGFVDCEGFDLLSIWSGRKFRAKRTQKREAKERQKAIEEAKPKGPPPAVVPKMAHQLNLQPAPTPARQAPARQPAAPQPIVPAEPMEIPAVPLQPIDASEAIEIDPMLPAFDDGSIQIDATTEAKNRIEATVARGDFVSAVRDFAAERKKDRRFVISPAAIGKLAEGLIRSEKIRPATSLLGIGADAYPVYAPRWRIRLASLELTKNQDPIAAIKQLKQVDKDALDSKLREQYIKLANRAKEMANG